MKKILSILFLFCSLIVSATNYYIKPTGNDSNTGLSDAQAWLTVTKVNSYSAGTGFNPGDSILFKRSGTYQIIHIGTPYYADVVDNGQGLWIRDSGTSGSRIVISAYGTGARPIITGRQSIPNWNTASRWTNTSGNIWRMVASIYGWDASNDARGRLWLNGAEAKKAQSLSVPTAAEPWTHSSTGYYLYVYSIGNPAGYYSNIEDQGWSNDCVIVGGSYQTYKYLDIRGCNHAMSIAYDKHYLIFENCKIGRDCGMEGMFFNGEFEPVSNVIIRNCRFDTGCTTMDAWMRSNTEDAIHLRYACTDFEIYNDTIINWEHAGFCLANSSTTDDVSNIYFHNNYLSGTGIDYSKGIDIGAQAGHLTGMKVYNNIIYDFANENQIAGPNVEFYCNIVEKTTRPAYYGGGDPRMSNGIAFEDYGGSNDASGSKIYNNNFINCLDPGIGFQTWGTVQMSNIEIVNNIFIINNTASIPRYQIYIPDSPSDIGATTYKNNLLWYTGATGSTDLVYYGFDATNDYPHTVTEFNAENGTHSDVITNNILGESVYDMFEDFDNHNYHLKSGSAAIGAGIDVGLYADFDGVEFKGTPSIGVYEVISEGEPEPEPEPVVNKLVVSGIHVVKSNNKFIVTK